MSETFWATKYKDIPIRLDIGDLTLQRMREMKHLFGEAYGIPTEFINLLLRGDMDAMACAVWIGQQKAGVEVENPAEIDFSMNDFKALPVRATQSKKGRKDPNPTPASQTPDSPSGASTTSTTDTSSTSQTSAD